jgi:cell division septal protein FtsQ
MGSTRRPALARPQAPRLGLRLGRAHLVALAVAAVLGLLYLAARQTSLFALRAVEVRGAPEDVARSVRAALEPLEGRSLVAIGEGDVERRLEALPSVLAASVDRDFPRTLRVTVRPERPVAVVRRAGEAWLVAATGRVIRRVDRGSLERLPRLWLPRAGEELTPGTPLVDDDGAAAVRALAMLPAGFPARVAAARGTPDDLTLVLGGKTELRLGEASELRLKLEVAATVLRSLSGAERDALAYLDVSLPTRPVGADKPQVET